MKITIRYFAGHRDIAGRAEEQLELVPGTTVGSLWELLVGRYPRLAGYSGRILYAVNQEFGTLATELHDGDEVAFVPPVSGGLPILDSPKGHPIYDFGLRRATPWTIRNPKSKIQNPLRSRISR